jgi:hypothetical protein
VEEREVGSVCAGLKLMPFPLLRREIEIDLGLKYRHDLGTNGRAMRVGGLALMDNDKVENGQNGSRKSD